MRSGYINSPVCLSRCSLTYSGMCLASDAQFSDFLDGMGPAQFVGRQTLATTSMGEEEATIVKTYKIRLFPRATAISFDFITLKLRWKLKIPYVKESRRSDGVILKAR